MKTVLIACEESQTVCKAFRERGFEAYSCDVVPCSGGHPEWHIMSDVLPLLNGNCSFRTMDGCTHTHTQRWDLIIAHPPCTFISNAGACRLYPSKGLIDYKRFSEGLKAKLFFMYFYLYGWFGVGRIAIENPIPSKAFELPEKTQMIQPYEFGHPYTKKTYLWLFGLPKLKATEIVSNPKPYVSCGTSANKGNKEKAGFSRAGGASKVRSKTFDGIAKAMAEQWGDYINE